MRVLRTALPAVLAAGLMGAVLPTAATAAPQPAAPRSAATPAPVSLQAAVAAATTGLVQRPALVHAGPGQAFSRRGAAVRDADGTTHVRYDRTYRGLRVLGGDVVVHVTPRGAVTGASATLTSTLSLGTKATVTRGRAATVARRQFTGTARSTTQALVVYAGGRPTLAWESVTRGVRPDGTPSRFHVVVDARSAKVLEAYDEIETGTGTGKGFDNGTVTIGTNLNGSTYELKDTGRGSQYTVDVNNGTDPSSSYLAGTIFTSSTNVFGDGTLSNRATAGADAHYGAQATWDFYKNTFGRSGIKNDGKGAKSRVHYGSNYDNAFWDDSCFCMTYGDGDGTSYYPFTSLDVAGHEMSHGVTSATAGLVYSGESGGLNEATSDIFGTMVEFSANNASDPGDFLIGEKIAKNGTPLRYMDKPSKDGSSYDCYVWYVGYDNVHYSSGVANHFFYLLSNGSGTSTYGTSPTCNSSTVTGIGRDKAAKIWYRALTTYFTSRTNYSGARAGTLSAASDLYGSTSTEYNAVKAAWNAVSVTR